MSYLVNILRTTSQGREWYDILLYNSPSCIDGLNRVSNKIEKAILNYPRDFTPEPVQIMNPFHKVRFEDVRIVMVCKEPYAKSVATGIPVQTKNNFVTPTSRIFREYIDSIFEGVDEYNYMDTYYGAGILIINASFTKVNYRDKRYALNGSHLSLWGFFMYPFLRFMKSQGIPILLLGKEAKELAHSVEPYNKVYKEEFPKDWRSEDKYVETMNTLIYKYILRSTNQIIADTQN